MKITFYGAARTVTGSCHMIEVNNKRFLIDCGMFQGRVTEQILNYESLPFDVSTIDFAILTHAHIDHSGRIPKLFNEGFNGPIYASNATVDLCGIMLPDSGHIQEKEIEWVNKKRMRAGKKPTEPMYTADDAYKSLKIFKGIDYNQNVVIDDSISFKLVDAGHMLGSSIVLLEIKEDGIIKKLTFTGDLGNLDMPILNDPVQIEGTDYLVMESTYGDRLHGEMKDQTSEFMNILLNTIDRGGNVIIPSFAVGRTQELLYEINKYTCDTKIKEKLKHIPVYVDSPLAVNATKVFEENNEYYDEDAIEYLLKGDNPLDFDGLHLVTSAEESKALNIDPTPKIIISASRYV
ncbi:MAG: MBL fold metallo-hydrolase [Clostridia bacterium]